MIALWLAAGLLAGSSEATPQTVGGGYREAVERYQQRETRTVDDLAALLEPEAKKQKKKTIPVNRPEYVAPNEPKPLPRASNEAMEAIASAADRLSATSDAIAASALLASAEAAILEEESMIVWLMMGEL